MSKPNILFLLSDQHHAGYLGSAGHPVVRTPHLDGLAAQGCSMGSAYCASPLCVPSRMAMLSGLLPSRTGVYSNGHSLRSEQPTFVHGLREGGYRTVLSGRMHFNGPDQRHGYVERLMGDITPAEVGGRVPEFGELGGSPGQCRESVELSGAGNSNVLEFDRSVTKTTVDFLRRFDGEEPLFLTVGFYGPHCPFVCPGDLYDYYASQISAPEVPPEFRDSVHPFIRQWLVNRGIEELDAGVVHRCVAAYCGLVEVLDRRIGTILEAWRANPVLRDSLIIYASDHGEMAGEKGMFWKSSFYEGSVRVPLIVSRPGEVSCESRMDHPCSLLDLGPTLLDWTGGRALPRCDGSSLRGVLRGEEPADPDRAVVSLLADIKGDAPGAMVRRGRWKFIRYHGYEDPQLFDLQNDPGEWQDLGCDPATAEIRAELDSLLDPHWDGAQMAEAVTEALALDQYWAHWRRSVDTDSDERWKARAAFNTLDRRG